MGKRKIKAIEVDLCTFRHNHAYPGIIQAYSGMSKTLRNSDIFRIVVYPEHWQIQNHKHIQNPGILRTLVYSEPPYIQNAGIFKIRGIFRTLSNIWDKRFAKIGNDYNYFRKLQLFSQYKFAAFSTSWIKYHEVVIICKYFMN